MTTTPYGKLSTTTAEEAAQQHHPGVNYERYFVPTIGTPFARPVIEAAALRAGERVVDVGSGTGVAARLAAERVGAGGTVVGVDPTPPMLEVARRTAAGIDWRQGVAEALPVAGESFDAVVSSLSFQFFADKEAALLEMHRVLVAGGRVAIGTPGPTPPAMAEFEGVLERHLGKDASSFVDAVFSVHDPDQVRSMLEAAGFDDVEAENRPLPLRLAPPADFFWQYVASTPLGAIVGQVDDDTRAAMEREIVEGCASFVDGDSLVMAPGLLLATARRPETETSAR